MTASRRTALRLDHAGFERLPSGLQMIWIGLLAGAGTVASAAFACATPFAAVAALAAATLPLRNALAVTLALWLGNQAVGFGMLDYPWDGETLIWGALIGAASLAAAFVAHCANVVAARQPAMVRLSLLAIAAFATYQAGLLLGSTIVAAHGGLAADIMAYVAFVNALWMIGLGAGYVGLQILARASTPRGARRSA